MTDGETAQRYEVLRQAAAAVLEATPADTTTLSRTYRLPVEALAQTLEGRGPQSATAREIQDPDAHFLTMRNYGGDVPHGVPFSLADRAQSIRRSLALDDATPEPRGYDPDVFEPTLTELQAMTVATLLRELAARLTATGDPGGADLATLTLQLADEVLAPTFVGAQR